MDVMCFTLLYIGVNKPFGLEKFKSSFCENMHIKFHMAGISKILVCIQIKAFMREGCMYKY